MPIQMGKYRSVSFSLRITTCWPLGMCTRMESTCISTNLAMPNSCPSYHRILDGRPSFLRVLLPAASIHFDGERARKEGAARPHRRPLPRLPGLLRAALADGSGRSCRERRLRPYVDVAARPAGTSGLRAPLVRSRRPDISPRSAGAVQGDQAADAARAVTPVSTDAGDRARLRHPDL